MSVYKDGSKWRVIYRYTDSRGERKQTQKRGFSTKKEAQAWEREQINKTESSLDMTFESFSEIYFEDMKKRLKDNTWHDLTIYDLRQRGNEVIVERDDAHEKLKAVRSEKSQLSSELQTVKAESRLYSEVCAMLERIAPDILRQAKEMVQAEKQREQQRQAEYQPTRKKKSWGL